MPSTQQVLLTLAAVAVALMACVHCAAWVRSKSLDGLARVDMDNLRTGDLVLFRWHTVGPVHQLFSVFTHVGMVVQRGGVKYILETHRRGDAACMGVFTGGVHLHRLHARVRAYRGRVFAQRLRPDAAPDARNLWRRLPSLSDIPYDDHHRSHFGSCCVAGSVCAGCGRCERRRGMFCSEFVGLLLQLLGLLPPDAELGCLTPESFVHLQVGGERLFGPPELVSVGW